METSSFKTESNILLGREELRFILKTSKTPSFADVLKIISEHVKKPEETIFVDGIKGKFGRESFLVKAYVYKSKEDKEKTHPVKVKNEGQAPKV